MNGGIEMSEKGFEKWLRNAVDNINEAYNAFGIDDDLFDLYEPRLERYAKLLNVDENWLEDVATEVRLFGWERCE